MKGAIGFCKNGSSFSLKKKLCFKPDTYAISQMNKKISYNFIKTLEKRDSFSLEVWADTSVPILNS